MLSTGKPEEAKSIVEEATGKNRNRIYVYRKYLDVMNEGIEPL